MRPKNEQRQKGDRALNKWWWCLFTVDLEITNACQGHCAFCPRAAITRPVGAMDTRVFEKVADTLMQTTAQTTLSGMGDPLSHPEWESFIEHFRKRGGEIGIQLSCASLNRDIVERLVNASPSFINLSLPSHRTETLLRLVPGQSPEALIQLGQSLAEQCRDRIPLCIIGVHTALDEPNMASDFIRFWKDRGVSARVSPCHSRGGNFTDRDILGPQSRPRSTPNADGHREETAELERPCGLFARHAFITWEGELLACCHDLTGDTVMGNLARENVSQLTVRKTALAQRVQPFALCAKCDEPLRLLPLPAVDQLPPKTRRERTAYFRSMRRWAHLEADANTRRKAQ